MIAGAALPPRPPRFAPLCSAFVRTLRRAAWAALMLGPMIGPLSAGAVGGEWFADDGLFTDESFTNAVTAPADRPPPPGGTESWADSGAGFAAGRRVAPAGPAGPAGVPPAIVPPELAALTAPRPTPRPVRAAPRVRWDWATGAGLAVHPVRSFAVAAGPRLPGPRLPGPALARVEPPAVATAVAAISDVPALAAPEAWPVFAVLQPSPAPAPRRVPLIAAKPAASPAPQTRRAMRERLEPVAAPDAVTRFLAATAPGTWAGAVGGATSPVPAARTAGASRTDGPLRR